MRVDNWAAVVLRRPSIMCNYVCGVQHVIKSSKKIYIGGGGGGGGVVPLNIA